MPVRDLFVQLIGYSCLLTALWSPFAALMSYCLLSFMKPQSIAWSQDVQTARLTLAVGVVMLVRTAVGSRPWINLRLPTVAFLMLWGWWVVSTMASVQPELSLEALGQLSKIAIAAVLITGVVRERAQMKWMVLLLALCPGVYAVKLGLHFIFSGRNVDLTGGPMGMDNNDTALFVAMAIPMAAFAMAEFRNRWARTGLWLVAGLAAPAVVLTASRGGMLAMAAAGATVLVRRVKLHKALLLGAVMFAVIVATIPEKTWERYRTIDPANPDASAKQRLAAWKVAWDMAADRPLVGVGPGNDVFLSEYSRYKWEPEDWARAAHSIWYSAAAETGFVGLGLYLFMLGAALWTTRRVRMLADEWLGGHGSWVWQYAAMIECALITFMVGATFLSKLQYEYIYALVMLPVPLLTLAEREADKARGRIMSIMPIVKQRIDFPALIGARRGN